jgi:hypothetical protein
LLFVKIPIKTNLQKELDKVDIKKIAIIIANMGLKIKSLLKIFYRKQDIADVLGVTRQAVQATKVFDDPEKIYLLKKAADKRMVQIKNDYREINGQYNKLTYHEKLYKSKLKSK